MENSSLKDSIFHIVEEGAKKGFNTNPDVLISVFGEETHADIMAAMWELITEQKISLTDKRKLCLGDLTNI